MVRCGYYRMSITLRLFNSSPWYRWPFLVDGLPMNSMVIFHGHVKNNQMVDFDVFFLYVGMMIMLYVWYIYLQNWVICLWLIYIYIYICDNMDYINMDNYG